MEYSITRRIETLLALDDCNMIKLEAFLLRFLWMLILFLLSLASFSRAY